MNRIAQFMTVSRARFDADWQNAFDGIPSPYDTLKLPRRATAGSAGYDFYVPATLTLDPGETVKVPTGMRCRIEPGWVLMLFPRSGLGFKYRLRLDNTVGIVDADYFGAKNEGHIFIKLTNEGTKTLTLNAGDAFAQGVFLPFGITEDDEASEARVGGFGSTDAT